MIADTDHSSDSCFKTEHLSGLTGADVKFVYLSAIGGKHGIDAVHLKPPSGVVILA